MQASFWNSYVLPGYKGHSPYQEFGQSYCYCFRIAAGILELEQINMVNCTV